jgi:hypothetical protein
MRVIPVRLMPALAATSLIFGRYTSAVCQTCSNSGRLASILRCHKIDLAGVARVKFKAKLGIFRLPPIVYKTLMVRYAAH